MKGEKMSVPCHRITMRLDGQEFETFEDIIPPSPGFKFLLVGKTPAPKSVQAGHYFYKNTQFWNRFRDYGLLNSPSGEPEDDYLVEQGYGITDIVKKPRTTGHEPSGEEYQKGIPHLLELIKTSKPRVLVFIYKGALDALLLLKFGIRTPSKYGFNPALDKLFGARVFAFPMPGTPCTASEAVECMTALAEYLKE